MDTIVNRLSIGLVLYSDNLDSNPKLSCLRQTHSQINYHENENKINVYYTILILPITWDILVVKQYHMHTLYYTTYIMVT